MTITTEEAEMLAALFEGKSAPAGCLVTGYNFTTALRSLAAERDALQARVAELEEALRNIEADCCSDYPPSHGSIKYACRDALEGKK